MKFMLFIPTFNCEGFIGKTIQNISNDLYCAVDEILIVDNQSTDNTLNEAIETISAKQNSSKYRILQNNSNIGLGGSFVTAYQECFFSNYNVLLMLHGDNQAQSDDLLKIISQFNQRNELAAVFGSRFSLRSKRHGYSLVRTFGNIGLNIISSILTGKIITELGSGLNGYNVQKLGLDLIQHLPSNISFDMNLLLYALDHFKEELIWEPIEWFEDGQTSNADNVAVGIDILKTLFKWKFNLSPTSSALPSNISYRRIDS